jgi:hypothetical protein
MSLKTNFKKLIKFSLANKLVLIIISILIILVIVLPIVLTNKSNNKSNNKTKPTQSVMNKMMSFFSLTEATPVKGYYYRTWMDNGAPTGEWDIGVLFGGEEPYTAINMNYADAYKITQNKKYLNIGGGSPDTGNWTIESINKIINQNLLQKLKSNGWTGVCLDIEVCTPNVSFVDPITNLIKAIKDSGLEVMVTISGSMPYQCQAGTGQGNDLIQSWVNNNNIDIISPQLYGEDGKAVYYADLSAFANFKGQIMPSIPYENDYENVVNYYKDKITFTGFFIWNNDNSGGGGSNYCGKTGNWADASKCQTKCPMGKDSECPTGESCFGGVTCGGGGGGGSNYCGKTGNWADASKCQTKCPMGKDSECPAGESCFAGVTCGGGGGSNLVFSCGKDWADSKKCQTQCPKGTDGECPSGEHCYSSIPC